MSGSSWDDTCPNCNGEMLCCSSTHPFDYITGTCIDCGFYYGAKTGQMSLKELNEYRGTFMDSDPLKRRKRGNLDRELKQ